MKTKRVHVVAVVPNMGFWRDETAKSACVMFGYFGSRPIAGVDVQRLSLLTVQGSVIAAQRHLGTKKVCQDPNVTHLLFLDSDMEFPRNTLHRLLAWDKDIVTCNCTTRMHPVEAVAHDFNGDRVDSRGKHGIEKVQQVGLAVALIKTDVLRKLRPPLYLNDWILAIANYCGEDVYFCQKAQEAGYDIWIDHELSIEVGHVGTYVYGHKDLKENEVSSAA